MPDRPEDLLEPSQLLLDVIRIAAKLPARLRGSSVACNVRDVHIGGVFLITTEPPPIGTSVDFEVEFPGTGWTLLRGTVRWQQPGEGAGIRFDDLQQPARAVVNDWVLTQARELKRRERQRG